MHAVFEKIIEKLEEMIHPKQLYFCKYARGGCKHLDNDDKDCMECVVENAIEIVKQEAEQYNNGWIPCSERLPDDFMSMEYLTTVKGHFYPEINYYCVANHKWFSSGKTTQEVDVIAWQSLPQPYQPKGE